jgi:hypothetical protein
MHLSKLLATANKKQHIIKLKAKVIQIGKPYRGIKYFFDNDIVIEIGTGTHIAPDPTNRRNTMLTDYESLWIYRGEKKLAFFRNLPSEAEVRKYLENKFDF